MTVTDTPSPTVQRPMAGVLAAATGVILWGCLVPLAKAADNVNGIVLGFHRLWIGSIAVLAVFYGTGGRLTKAGLRTSVWGGILFGLDVIFFFSALKLTTVANATVVGALQPALLLYVGARWFGEQVNGALIGLTVVAIGGAGLVAVGSASGSNDEWSLLGDVCALLALASWTGYFIASKRARDSLSSLEYLASFLVVASVMVLPVALLAPGPFDPGAEGWWIVIVVAVLSGGLGHFLMNFAHPHIPLYLASLLTLAVPVMSTTVALIFLDESINALQVLGMIVVLSAVGLVVLRTERGRDTDADVLLEAEPSA
ncbi:MAG TPA: DMT family transporter [Acidimicrobiales bacterium]